MTRLQYLFHLIKYSLLSILLFFSVCFIQVLYCLRTNADFYALKFGFPFPIYHRFWVDCDGPNFGWGPVNLLIDIGVFWIFTIFIGLLWKAIQNKNSQNPTL